MMASKASQTTMRKCTTPATNSPGAGMTEFMSNSLTEHANALAYDSSRALTEISALKSLETGQPVSAAVTAASTFALSAPGTRATRSRWLLVMLKPSPTFSRLTVAVVSSFWAVKPAPPSCAESAIVKHPACAAANSSSGLVPTPFSKRVLKEYWVCLRTPLSVEIDPLPLLRSPCQTALPLRCMLFLLAAFEAFERFVISRIRFFAAYEGYIERAKLSRVPRHV